MCKSHILNVFNIFVVFLKSSCKCTLHLSVLLHCNALIFLCNLLSYSFYAKISYDDEHHVEADIFT